jgi:hypothetical protein
LARHVIDKLAPESIGGLIADLAAQKTFLHPKPEK